jgi:hypothetical protein
MTRLSGMVPTASVFPAGDTFQPFGSSSVPSVWDPGFELADGMTPCANVKMRGVAAAPARIAANPKASLRIVVGSTTLWTIKVLIDCRASVRQYQRVVCISIEYRE